MGRYNLHIIILILLLAGCSYPVLDLPETPDKIIVQCEFTHGEDIDIYVFKGVGLPSFGEIPDIPDSIDVLIKRDGNPLDVNHKESFQKYFQVRTETLQGQEFDLRIEMPNEEVQKVRAKSFIPFKSELVNLNYSLSEWVTQGDTKEVNFNLEFDIEDENQEKYFELLIERAESGRVVASSDTLWSPVSEDLKKVDIRPEEKTNGILWLSERKSFLIDYYSLESKHIDLSMIIKSEEDDELSLLSLNFKTHTRDGYNYLKSLESTKSNYQAEFPILVSNIENGIGIFSGYARSESQLLILHD